MVWSAALIVDAALSAVHILTFGLGITAVVLPPR